MDTRLPGEERKRDRNMKGTWSKNERQLLLIQFLTIMSDFAPTTPTQASLYFSEEESY